MITRSTSQKDKMSKSDETEFDVKQAFKLLQTSLDTLHNEVKEIKLELCTLKDIKQSLEYTQADLDEVKGNVAAALETKTKSQTAKIIRLQQTATENQRENASAKEHLLKIDTYSRRENLIFSGVPEEENERPVRTLEITLNLVETKLKISHANQMKIQRCHRLGSPRKGVRDIIIRFAYFGDREMFGKRDSNLKDPIYLLKRTSAKK